VTPAATPSGTEEGAVVVERRPDGVALVTMDRPRMNALSVPLLERLRDELAGLRSDLPGALVLWGGSRLFAAGADVAEFAEPDAAPRIARAFTAATAELAGFPRVTVAAITGYALGGGLELALACDLRVASSRARLGQPEVLLGLIPGAGATQRLPRLVGTARAKDLIFTGRHVDAEEAMRIGLVDRIAAPDSVLDDALALAAGLAAGPVQALAAAKRVVDAGMDMDLADALAMEADAFVTVAGTEDARIGVTSFLEHGPGRARFVGR